MNKYLKSVPISIFCLLGVVLAQEVSPGVTLRGIKAKNPLSEVKTSEIIQQNSCEAMALLGGSVQPNNYLISVNKAFPKITNQEDYFEWFFSGKPNPRAELSRRLSIALSVMPRGELLEPRVTTAKIESVTGNPKIKSPIKIPIRKTALADCEKLDVVDSFIKKGRIFAENEAVKLKFYDLKNKNLPSRNIVLSPGEEVFIENQKVCGYEGQAYFARYDFFDELEFWQNPRKAFSRQKTDKGTMLKLYDGSSILLEDREGFEEAFLDKQLDYQSLKSGMVILSASDLVLQDGDEIQLSLSNGIKRTIKKAGHYCYQISTEPIDSILAASTSTNTSNHQGTGNNNSGEDSEDGDEDESNDNSKKGDKPGFKAGVNNVNTCRPNQFPPDDKSILAGLDRIRGHLCDMTSKDISTRQNGIHINQPHHAPNNLANRGQDDTESCDSPAAPRSKKPRSTKEGRTSSSDRFDEKIKKIVYGYDNELDGLGKVQGIGLYGDTSYTASQASVKAFKAEQSRRDLKKIRQTREYEPLQQKFDREAQSQEEEFKALKLTTCQYKKFRKNMEDLANKPKISS